MKAQDIRIDGERLWQSLMEMAAYGATAAGGCNRQALSDEDKLGRDCFKQWCLDAGCTIRIDDMGNIFARREGSEPQRAPIVTGSHLDTQPTGGKFDGVYGVLAGLEVVRALNDANYTTRAPIDVVVWTNEEGTRFSPAMNGSGVWAGEIDKTDAYAQLSVEGMSFRDELQRIGYCGDIESRAFPIDSAFELHIEQGPILEQGGFQIGVVTGVQAMRWYDLAINGTPCHAGTTPMHTRSDPLASLCQVLDAFLDNIGDFGEEARATFGLAHSEPGSRNTVPQRASCSVDLRHPHHENLDAMATALDALLKDACARRDTDGSLKQIWDSPAIAFDAGCIEAVSRASLNLGYEHHEMVSGAGHDAANIARVAPTSMIFVPCAGGLSHNEAESASIEDLAAGCDVLLHAIILRDARYAPPPSSGTLAPLI